MRLAGFLCTAVVLAACAGERSSIERCVRGYEDAIVVAFRTGDVAPLERVADAAEVRKVTALVDLKRAAGVVLEATLDDIAVESVESLGADSARAVTRERWTYFDRALKPGQSPGPRFVARMTMQYELGRKERVWRVLGVRTIDNEFIEPAGLRPGARAHGMEAQHDAH
jgi:hypothetical protein